MRMISERSCDTKDWSKVAENSFANTGIDTLKYIEKKTVI